MKYVIANAFFLFLSAAVVAEDYSCIGEYKRTDEEESKFVKSEDPNEIVGTEGRGDLGYVRPGTRLCYTVYFENKSTASAAACEVNVTLPKNPNLDWSTLQLGEIAFGNAIDSSLIGRRSGSSEYALGGKEGWTVRTEVTSSGDNVVWNLRIWDPATDDHFPEDAAAGFLPPNDATHRGEGHVGYTVCVKDGVDPGSVVEAEASIVFDTNAPIRTEPGWTNALGRVVNVGEGRSSSALFDPTWVKARVGAGASDAQVEKAMNATGANGLKVWQSAALGLDPDDADDGFRVDVPQNDDPGAISVRALKGSSPEGAWMPVTYRMDGDATGTAQDGTDFSIRIDGADDPTGIYCVSALFADDEGNALGEVPAANAVGILRKVSAAKREIIAVPWRKFAKGTEPIAVSNLVKTASLAVGDRLYVYNGEKDCYNTWELKSDRTWKSVKTVKMVKGKLEVQEADSPEVATVGRGSGVWLERHDLNTPITLVGQHEATLSEIEIAQGTTEAPNWNLVANPAISNWNLNAICEGVAVTDRIIVPTGGEPRIYTRDDANTRWGYIRNDVFKNTAGIEIVRPTRVEDDVEIPAGTGFWYVSEGGSPVIKW